MEEEGKQAIESEDIYATLVEEMEKSKEKL